MSAAKAAAFFEAVFGPHEGGYVNLFAQSKEGAPIIRWFGTDDDRSSYLFGKAVESLAPTSSVYLGYGVRKEKTRGRGGSADIAYLAALWGDLDYKNEKHPHGFTDEAQALAYLDSLPLKPSFIIRSGGGLQPVWMLQEPVEGPEACQTLLDRWRAFLEANLPDGVRLDNVYDSARMMRAPVGLNHKYDPPREVSILRARELRWGMDEIAPHLPLVASTPTPPAEPTVVDLDRPGDDYSAKTDPGTILEEFGCKLARTDRNGDRHYLRPGKERMVEGTGITVYADDGHTTIYSETFAAEHGLETNHPYSPFQLRALLSYGDFENPFAKTAEVLRREGYGRQDVDVSSLVPPEASQAAQEAPGAPGVDEDDERLTWSAFADMAEVIRTGAKPLPATILQMADKRGALFYKGKVNGIHGDSGLGKSWVCQIASKQVLKDGRSVLVIDFESSAHEWAQRLMALGVEPEVLVERFLYLSPLAPAMPRAATKPHPLIRQLLETITERGDIDLCIVDSVGEAFAVEGIDENNDSEVGPWYRMVARPLADAGPAVVCVDHSTKAKDNHLYPSGSKRKRAAVTGAAYHATSTAPPTKDKMGFVDLTCAKDRHGNYRQGERVAIVEIRPAGFDWLETVVRRVEAEDTPTADYALGRVVAEVVSIVEFAEGPMSKLAVRQLIETKCRNELKQAAIDQAIAMGCLTARKGGPAGGFMLEFVKRPGEIGHTSDQDF